MKLLPYLLSSLLLHAEPASFSSDAEFLKEHTGVITLSLDSGASVLVVPEYQGRVMTSTFNAESGPSFGWINRPVIEQGVLSAEEEKGKVFEKIYIFGGEERFWVGPEGGQFTYFFEEGKEFTDENWFTPAFIDTDPYDVKEKSETSVSFAHVAEEKNYSGHTFKMGINRKVEILDLKTAASNLSVSLPEGVKGVGYETTNTLVNLGENAWTPETGMPSIWLLGMYAASPSTTIAIPIKDGKTPKVNDYEFGKKKIPADHLKTTETHIFMKGDATNRGKIGVTPERSHHIAGSYDADGKVLTVVTYTPQEAKSGYVSSLWKIQEEPFSGDVINAYNDGPPAPGVEQLGQFYELETSSPAAALKPKEQLTHKQQTYHFHGSEEDLDTLSQKLLKVSLKEIKEAL